MKFGDFEFATDSLLDPSDCQEFKAHFRRANLDGAADVEPVFPNARLNHLNCIFYPFVVHAPLPICPQLPEGRAIQFRFD